MWPSLNKALYCGEGRWESYTRQSGSVSWPSVEKFVSMQWQRRSKDMGVILIWQGSFELGKSEPCINQTKLVDLKMSVCGREVKIHSLVGRGWGARVELGS